uniref:NCK interacting protein with SH3 domain n=1 Tax=Mus musculus TaxID=10090 RepID=A0A0A6YWW3_MOUSE
MYRALYAFRSAEPNAMAFAAGETFLVLERSSTHWWLAARARSGETGYVPPAYLHRLQVFRIVFAESLCMQAPKCKL